MLRALAFALLFVVLPAVSRAVASPDFSPASFYGLQAPPLRGPQQALGLVIWNHGTDALPLIDQAPVLAWYFAQRGWDVYRLYRGPERDRRWTATQMVEARIQQAQAMGYRRILLLGHSAGAYAAVEAAQARPVTGVIALAPAAFGHIDPGWSLNDHAMRPFWRRLANSPLRIVAAYFPQDIYYEAEIPATRGPWLRNLLQQGGVAHLVIDRPVLPGVAGHSSGLGWSFARHYAGCIHHLIDTGGMRDCSSLSAEDRAIFATAVPSAADAIVATHEGRWRDTSSGGGAVTFEISRDDLNMPLLRVTLQNQGSSDWPILVTPGGLRSATAFGYFAMRREGDMLIASLARPGDDTAGELRWRLIREPGNQLSSAAGSNRSATPLMQ